AVLPRRVGAPLDRAFLREAARALEKQLGAFAPAQLADGTRVACHASNPPFLGRAAPVVRNRRHVADRPDLQPRAGERLNGGLAAGAGTLHAHVHALHAEVQRFARRLLGRHGGGEGRRLLGALEPSFAGRAPGDRVALQVGDRDERVVERRGDVCDAFRLDDFLGALRARRACWCWLLFVWFLFVWFLFVWFLFVRHVPLLFQHGLLLARDRAPRSLLGARIGVRALAAHRQILAMAAPAIRKNLPV